MNLQSLASVLCLLQAFLFYGGGVTAQELADSADSRTAAKSLRKLMRTAKGIELRIAVNSWSRSLPDRKSALTAKDVSMLMDASRRADFYVTITGEQKTKHNIGCRAVLARPASILSEHQVDSKSLFSYFDDPSPFVRRAAIAAVGLNLRVKCFAQDDSGTRTPRPLKDLDSQAIAEHLLKARHDPDGTVRSTVARSLQWVSGKDGKLLSTLRSMLDDSNVTVRDAAISAVRSHGDDISMEHIQDLAKLFFQSDTSNYQLPYTIGEIASSGNQSACDTIIDSFYPLCKVEIYRDQRSGQVKTLTKAAIHASPKRLLRVLETICQESASSNTNERRNAMYCARTLIDNLSDEKLAALQAHVKSSGVASQVKVMQEMLARLELQPDQRARF